LIFLRDWEKKIKKKKNWKWFVKQAIVLEWNSLVVTHTYRHESICRIMLKVTNRPNHRVYIYISTISSKIVFSKNIKKVNHNVNFITQDLASTTSIIWDAMLSFLQNLVPSLAYVWQGVMLHTHLLSQFYSIIGLIWQSSSVTSHLTSFFFFFFFK